MNKEEIKEILQRMRAHFKSDERGTFYSSLFSELSTRFVMNASLQKQKSDIVIYKNSNFISTDLNNLFTLIARLDWQHNLYRSDNLNDGLWSQYASLDIDHFHIQIQSILDYITVIIKELNSNLPKAALGERPNFGKLRGWVTKNYEKNNSSNDKLLHLINSCSWFPQLNEIRNATIHRGANTLTFYGKETIIFQNYSGTEGNIFDDHLMLKEIQPDGSIKINTNVVDFKKYAPLVFSRIFLILEDFSEVVSEKYNISDLILGRTKSYHFGHNIFLEWCDDFIKMLTD